VQPDDIGTHSNVAALRRLLTHKISLYDSQPLARFLETQLPSGVKTFGDLKVHLIPLIHGRVPFWDFGHAAELIAYGRAVAETVLEAEGVPYRMPRHRM